MKKLSSKIIAGLMASFIGLSPVMGTQVSAMWQPPIHQQNLESYYKEELLEALPDLWQRFWHTENASFAAYSDKDFIAVHNAARAAVKAAAYNGAWYASKDAVEDAVSGIGRDNIASIWDARDIGFANAWRNGGVAYNIVKDNDITYFQNLVRVLEKQTTKLENLIRKNEH